MPWKVSDVPDAANPAFLDQIRSKAMLVEAGYRLGRESAVAGPQPAGLLFAGMGGSGAVALLVRDAVSSTLEVPFAITQQYAVPKYVRRGWHVLAISYSGETEETLEAAREAARRGCSITSFSTGGSLAAIAARNVRQPAGFQPRVALAHSWFSVLGFMSASGMLTERIPVAAAAAAIREVDAACGPDVAESQNEAKQLARFMFDRIPQIYATPAFSGIATFFASLLNENAKKIADVDEIPECNHNALTAWSGDPSRRHFAVLVLHALHERPELTRRIDFMRQRYAAWGVPWHQRQFGPATGFADHVVEQARALQLLDYVSFYSAALRGVDPAQIDAVVGLKAYLREGSAGLVAPAVLARAARAA